MCMFSTLQFGRLGFSFIGVRALSGQLEPLYSGMFYFGFHY